MLTEEYIDEILKIFASKENEPHFAQMVEVEKIRENDYNLAVSSYVEAKDTREVIDITKLNAEIQKTVERIGLLRQEIDQIIKEIEI